MIDLIKFYSGKYKTALLNICGVVLFFSLILNPASGQSAYARICNEGFEFEKTGNIDAAIGKYTDAIISNPKIPDGYTYRAKAKFKKQNYDEALTDISQAINISPNTVAFYEVRAECYKAQGSYEKAIVDYSAVIAKTGKQDKQLPVLYQKKGQMLYNLKHYEEAISDFNQAIKISSGEPQIAAVFYYWRGLSYFRLNRYADSAKDIELYLSSGNKDLLAVFYQGLSYLKAGDTSRAKINASKIVEMDPSKEIYFSGDHLLDLYDLDGRRKIVKQSVDDAHVLMEEEKTITSKTLGNIKLSEAFGKLNTAWLYASGIEPTDKEMVSTILKDLFTVHSKLKDKPEINETARKFMVQATTATTEKKYNEAIFLWDKVLSIAPYFPLAYFNKALLFEHSGNFSSSIENMNKYLELYPDAKDARGAKDKIYEWEGKVKTQPVSVVASEEVMKNEIKPYKPEKSARFILKGGLSMPTANTAVFKTVPYTTATSEIWQDVFTVNGTIGLKQGFFVETGLTLDLSQKKSMIRFYYAPIMLAYSQNSLDWTTAGGIFTKTSIYTKPMRSLEIAQRYGIGFQPAHKLLLAAYYRPAFLFPFGFEIIQKAVPPDLTAFTVSGTMGTKKSLTISHSLGLSIGYSFVTLSYERFFANEGYDVRVYYHGATTSATGYDYHLQGRIPIHSNRIGLTLSF